MKKMVNVCIGNDLPGRLTCIVEVLDENRTGVRKSKITTATYVRQV